MDVNFVNVFSILISEAAIAKIDEALVLIREQNDILNNSEGTVSGTSSTEESQAQVIFEKRKGLLSKK